MLQVTDAFKSTIKQLTVQSDGKVDIVNSSGTLSFDRDDITKIEIYGTAFQNDTVLGTIAQHSLTLELLGDLTKSISLNKENTVKVYLGILVDGEYEYVQYQDFLVTELSYSDTTNVTKIIATDNLVKLNKEFVDSNTYPMTLKSYLESVLTYCGLQLENTSFFNDDFSVTTLPFADYTNAKEIVYRVAELAMSYVVVNKVTNKIELKRAFEFVPDANTHDALTVYTHDQLSVYTHNQLMYGFANDLDNASKDNYWSFKFNDNNFGQNGINTLVLKISQVEGENNTVENSVNVAIDGTIETSIVNNPFINSEAKRLSVINGMFDEIDGYKFNPYSLEYRGFPYLELGDFIIIEQMNEEEVAVPIYETNIKWNGALVGKIAAKTLSITETKYKYVSTTNQKIRNAEIMVDKANGEISLIATDVESLDGRVTDAEASIVVNANAITTKVSTTDYTGNVIASKINQTATTIQISASKINLSGYVTISNLTDGVTTISGSNIKTGTIDANSVSVVNLSASSITSGTINADRINAGYLTAGTIGGWNINSSSISRSGITLGSNYVSLTGNSTSDATVNFITNGGTVRLYGYSAGGIACSGAFIGDSYISAAGRLYGAGVTLDDTSFTRSIYPSITNTYGLGSSTARWASIWQTSGSVVGSDRRLKEDIKPIENGINFILNLNPVEYKYKDGNRKHYGLIAQEVKETMTNNGIDDVAIYVDPSIIPDWDIDDEEENNKEHYLALRYDELIAPMIQTIQSLEKRIKELEDGY